MPFCLITAGLTKDVMIRNSSCIVLYYKWPHFVDPMVVRLEEIPAARQYRMVETLF